MLKYWSKYQHSFWSGIVLAIRTITGFGVQKVVAIFYGPAGTTLFSHFQNFVALFSQPIQDAVANGLISAFSKSNLQKAQIVGTSIIILCLLVVSSGLILLVSNQFQHSYFSFNVKNWLLIIPSIFLFCFGLIVSAIYVIQEKLMLYSFLTIIQWAVFFLSVFYLEFELNQFLIYWLSIQSVFSVILIVPIYSYLKCNFKIDEKIKNHFKQFLIMALTIWLSSKWVDYFVREYAIQEFGTIQTGLWQSVVRISEGYKGIVISFLFLSLYPLLSRKLGDGTLSFMSLKKYYFKYFFVSVGFLFLVFQFNDFILTTLYDVQYVDASNLFQIQIVGDIFAFLAFPFSIYLIAAVKTKAYIVTELLSALIYVILLMMNDGYGIEILVYANVIRFICYFLMVFSITIKSLRNVS